MAEQMKRREFMMKAAVVGGAAWVAPVIMSSAAEAADGTCTPKCTIASITAGLTVSVVEFCLGGKRGVSLKLQTIGGSCPCGGTPLVCGNYRPGGVAASWKNGSVTVLVNEPGDGPATNPQIDISPGTANMATGTWTPVNPLQLALRCRDRGLDNSWRVANVFVTFNHTTIGTTCVDNQAAGTATFTTTNSVVNCTVASANCPVYTP